MLNSVFIFIFGLIIGSFLNVCIYRLPRDESVVRPHSHCPNCKRPLKWYDNIPILSYLILKGRCRYCKWRIPFRYPMVEFLTAGLFLFYYKLWGVGINMVFFSIFTSGLIVASFSDFETRMIPDQVSLGLLPLGFIFSFYNPLFKTIYGHNPFLESIGGAFLGAALIYLTGLLGKLIFRKDAMGFGDVKFMLLIGSFLGWKLTVLNYFIAPFFALSYGIYRKIRYKDDYLPYGPFLAIGALFVFFFRERILEFVFYL